ncbi:hypothetical protein F4778DRAFT_747857 [Xylariomycetidae sp. FL2044]|nr:hypothetical protein F4778DRAFT_747857 [Xylariomycetidae sp. FL2044]
MLDTLTVLFPISVYLCGIFILIRDLCCITYPISSSIALSFWFWIFQTIFTFRLLRNILAPIRTKPIVKGVVDERIAPGP